MSFVLKGSQISTLQLKGRFKSKMLIQKYRNETQNSYYLVHGLYGTEKPNMNKEAELETSRHSLNLNFQATPVFFQLSLTKPRSNDMAYDEIRPCDVNKSPSARSSKCFLDATTQDVCNFI